MLAIFSKLKIHFLQSMFTSGQIWLDYRFHCFRQSDFTRSEHTLQEMDFQFWKYDKHTSTLIHRFYRDLRDFLTSITWEWRHMMMLSQNWLHHWILRGRSLTKLIWAISYGKHVCYIIIILQWKSFEEPWHQNASGGEFFAGCCYSSANWRHGSSRDFHDIELVIENVKS